MQCSNYHRARVGRGPPTSLNGPLLEENLGVQRGPPSAPLLVRIQGGRNAERFLEMPLKNFAAHIDVRYGFGVRKKKKKVVRNFGRINEHFWGKMKKIFRNAPKKSSKNFGKNLSPDSEVLDPPVIRSIASLALTIVWAPYLFFGNSTTGYNPCDHYAISCDQYMYINLHIHTA